METISKASPNNSNNGNTMKDQLQASASQFWSSVKSLEKTMKRPIVSPEGDANKEQEGVQASLESVIRVMFGPCTSGAVTPTDISAGTPEPISPPSSSKEKVKSRSHAGNLSGNEESIYMKLFSDNQMRAEEAVCHLREQLEGMNDPRSPQGRYGNQSGNDAPRIFPVSSPKHAKTQQELAFPVIVANSPKKATQPQQPTPAKAAPSFDDGVSAISQETLDEIALAYERENGHLNRVYSDVTQDPFEKAEESWKYTANPDRWQSPQRQPSPFRLTRPRSQCTTNTKQSRRTLGSKSTLSTQTNEFASAWKRDEQKYWQDVVNEESERDDPAESSAGFSSRHEKLLKVREFRRRRSKDLKSRQGGTITTVNSSVYSSGLESQQDLVVVKATDSDPDRLKEVLIMPPGTEMAEI